MSEERRLGELARRLKFGGKLTASERQQVLRRVKTITTDNDVHNLARVFALSEPPTPENVALIAPLLRPDLNDYDLWGVILALCSYWDLTNIFQEELVQLVSRPSLFRNHWQTGFAAFRALGELAYTTKDPRLIARLLQLYDLAETPSDLLEAEDQVERLKAVHESIDVAMSGLRAGIKYINFKVPGDLDKELIRRARDLVLKSGTG